MSRRLQPLIADRLRQVGAPSWVMRNPIGYGMAAPTILSLGSEAQRQRYLRPLFTCEEIWCQLFSEPGAGSDVASLAIQAERDGDEWILNGQKVWTSLAHTARFGMVLARTRSRGREAQGHHLFRRGHACARRRGPPAAADDRRRRVQRGVLHRRTHSRRGATGRRRRRLAGCHRHPDERTGVHRRGRRAPRQRADRHRVGPVAAPARTTSATPSPGTAYALWVEAEVQRLTNQRAAASAQLGTPGPEGSTAKLAFAELNKRIYDFCLDLLGPEGMLYDSYEMRRPDGGNVGRRGRSRGCSSGPGPTPSRAGPPRSCATSSASGSSACPVTSGPTRGSPGPGAAQLRSATAAPHGGEESAGGRSRVLEAAQKPARHAAIDP